MRRFFALALLATLLGPLVSPALGQAPPPVPALPDTERRTSYALTASTCPACSVGFALYGDGVDYANWLELWIITGTGTTAVATKLTPVTDWTLSSATGPLATIPRPITNATITLTLARTGTLQIVGDRRPRRLSQFAENRGVAARDLNQTVTDLVAENREQWDKMGRALVTAPGDTIGALPAAAVRAGGVLAFDGSGNPIITAPLTGLGNVLGPSVSVVGHIAIFNNTTGTLLADGGAGGFGTIGAGEVIGNPTAFPAPATTTAVSPLFDQAFCSTATAFPVRTGTAWACSTGQTVTSGHAANLQNLSANVNAFAAFNAVNNGGAGGFFGVGSTAYAGPGGAALANRAFVRASSGSAGLVLQNDGTNPTLFLNNLSEFARFDTNNRFLMGAPTAATGSSGAFNPKLQQHETGNGGIAALRWSNDNGPPALSMWKSRGASIGSHGAVQANDDLGQLRWQGDDGIDFFPVVQLLGQVDGTVGASDIPGRLLFNTRPSGGSAPLERFRLDSTGKILFGHTASVLANTVSAIPFIQANTVTAQGHAYAFAGYRWTNNPDGGSVVLAHSRSDNAGTQTILQNNDELGAIVFNGSDGAQFQAGGLILGAADGAPALNSMPMRLGIWTSPSGSVSPLERLRVDSSGNVIIPGRAAVVSSGSTSIFQSHDTSAGVTAGFFRWAASAAAANMHFSKSRSATIGTNTVVQQDDNLGILQFNGADGTNLVAAAQIIVAVDGTPGANDMPGRIAFATSPDGSATPVERARITNGGIALFGSNSVITTNGGSAHLLQLHSTIGAGSANFRWSANGGSANYVFSKSRGASVGSHGAVTSGDNIGAFTFNGDDGTDFIAAAGFLASVDGTVGAGVMPGRIVFQTSPAGSSTPTERMRINAPGHISYSGTAPIPSSCGTTPPPISGNDVEGEVTMGTGTPTGCVITFATAYSPAPRCVVTWQTNLASMQYTVSTTAITLVQTATSSNKVNYVCHGT